MNPDLMPGTVITNRVTIKSNEMPESIASVDALAQSDSELIITGTVHYGGTHTGLVHIAAADMNDLLAYEDQADVHDLGLAAHITIPEPGPYSLTIPHAPVGHSYVIVAQMDIDNSGLFSIESFQQYEPSGHYNGCAWGGCNASGAVPGELLPALDVEIYLSDYEPSCILLDTFDADYLSPPATSMDYYNGYLWICQYHNGIDIYQVNPNTGALVNTYDLGNGRCAGLEWIGDDLWTCFQGPTSWTIRQYTYDGQAFTSVVSYPLPMDWNVVRNASIAWNGTLLWAQEEGHCGHIYKLDLSSGALLDTISECAFTYNKWLGFSDMEDICF